VEKPLAIQITLFILTFFTTLVAGTYLSGGNPLRSPTDLALGLMFSVPLLSILTIHEMGHYTAARRHNVSVTPPYFIPVPPIPPFINSLYIGTFGAFIKIKSPLPDRNALMDIGAAGPLAGALMAIPVLMAGLFFSSVRPSAGISGIPLGESLLFKALSWLVLGEIPKGYDVVLHPVAFAGWIGLLVTMLNLLPSGQLDGGHIAYAFFGVEYHRVARLIPFFLLLMGLLWPGWFVWAGLLFFLKTRHPGTTFEDIPLTRGRRLTGIAATVLFLLCFTPNPIPI
jgi:membrane-associated protease RseP (regulator of RpoE activity)